MSLILRTDLSRPLKHEELDGNFIYVNIAEWARKSYERGQYVLRKVEDSGILYYCDLSHTEFLYDQYGDGDFVESFIENNVTKIVWRRVGSGEGGGATVASYYIDGTNSVIELSDGELLTVNVNDISITDEQYSIGLSNHSYQLISNVWSNGTINSETFKVSEVVFGSSLPPAKQNIVVIDLNTNQNFNHIVRLPNNFTLKQAGIIYKFICKNSNNTNLDKFLMIFSDTKKLISTHVKTLVNGKYFLPLETMESIEVIWDGYDFLVTNIVKQPYVALNAKNYTQLNPSSDGLFTTDYLERNINDLL